MGPFIVLKEIGLAGSTLSKVHWIGPLSEWATTLPETLVRVTWPLLECTSISPLSR